MSDLSEMAVKAKVHMIAGEIGEAGWVIDQMSIIAAEALAAKDAETQHWFSLANKRAIMLIDKDTEIARLREALEHIRGYAPEVTHGWATHVRNIARQALEASHDA